MHGSLLLWLPGNTRHHIHLSLQDRHLYELLGGKVRDKARIYVNFKANTPDEFAKKALELKNQGYTAIRYSMGHPQDKTGRCGESYSQIVFRMEKQLAAIREAVGWDMDIAIECHRGMRPAEAIECGKVLSKYHPYFYEDPIPAIFLPAVIPPATHISGRI